jgi:hypothetical protein
MSWVTPLTADTAELAAGALAWFAAPLDPGGGAGTLAAGAAGEEAAPAADAWLPGPGWPAELGWPAGAGWAGGCGAGDWPAEDGPWLPPLPGAGVLPGPGRRLWAAPATDPAADAALPGRPAVSPLTPAAEPGACAVPGFWSADARPARSTAKTSAAAKPPHAYRQTLKASIKARERVADPSTANTLLPVSAIMHIFLTAGSRLTCPVVRVKGVFLHKAASRRRKDTSICDDMMCGTVGCPAAALEADPDRYWGISPRSGSPNRDQTTRGSTPTPTPLWASGDWPSSTCPRPGVTAFIQIF